MPTEVSDKGIRLADFVPEEGAVDGTVFRRCRFAGPGVLWLYKGVSMRHCQFGTDDPDSLWWTGPPDPYVAGAVRVSNCVFDQCDFLLVGFTGPDGARQEFRDSFTR